MPTSNKISHDSELVKYRFGLAIEQVLGHITQTQDLERWLSDDLSVEPIWMRVPAQSNDIWQKVPAYSLRSGLRARQLVRQALQQNPLDCLLFHTQGTALFSLDIMRRIPSVVSLDVTPTNFKTIGATYGYKASTGLIDRLKFAWYSKVFHSAAALVAWSEWAKTSLIRDYGVAPDKIQVILHGVELSQWQPTVKEVAENRPLRLLFVGGDFARKGGHILLEAFRNGLADRCTLDIVTKDETVCSQGAIRVHRGLTPNSPELQKLFADADLFIFPTLGDANPLAAIEAMASGLPVVSTNVGALAEEVEDDVTGLLIPTNDPGAIVTAVRSLANNPQRLVEMGIAGRKRAERLFDGERSYKALIEVLKQCADKGRDR